MARLVCLMLVPLLACAAGAIAAGSRSAAAAAQLVKQLEARGLQAFAAEDPARPGRFAALLYFPGVQLLAIRGTYAAPALLRELIESGEYRQVYVDLSTAAERDGRLFVEDYGRPGLSATRTDGEPFDITWWNTSDGLKYDRTAAVEQRADAAYRSRFDADDAAYAELLQVLLHALDEPGASALTEARD